MNIIKDIMHVIGLCSVILAMTAFGYWYGIKMMERELVNRNLGFYEANTGEFVFEENILTAEGN